jgi:hypothetical protein
VRGLRARSLSALVFVVLCGCPAILGIDHEYSPAGLTEGGAPDAPGDQAQGSDAKSHDGPVLEAGAPDVAKLPSNASCTSNASCQSGTCGDSKLLGPSVTLPSGSGVCTESCCSSLDCHMSGSKARVCYPAPGGNYCLEPGWVSVGATGIGSVDSPCSNGGDCLSGVCEAHTCRDTCCADSDCPAGNACQISTLDQNQTMACGPSNGGAGPGADCSSSACASNLCISNGPLADAFCTSACCGDSDCPLMAQTSASTICGWNDYGLPDGGDSFLRICMLPQMGGAFGTTCTKNTECASNLCGKGGLCTQPCCTSADCKTGTCGAESFSLGSAPVELEVCILP